MFLSAMPTCILNTSRGGAGLCPKKGQWSRWRIKRVSLTRSSWGNWRCLARRKGSSGETISLSTSAICRKVVDLLQVTSHRTGGKAFKLHWGSRLLGQIPLWRRHHTLEQAAQQNGWVTIPLEVFSNLDKSIILSFTGPSLFTRTGLVGCIPYLAHSPAMLGSYFHIVQEYPGLRPPCCIVFPMYIW